MKILITGFKPFNNEPINPSLEVINIIDKNYNNHEIHTLTLDVAYDLDFLKIKDEIDKINPDLVLLLGQAGGRKNITLEYFALGIKHANIPDNNQKMVNFELINHQNLAYKTNLDILKILNNMDKSIFNISFHAGTFICNEIYYKTLKYINDNKLNTLCGFIHLPYLPTQVTDKPNVFSMNLDIMLSSIYKIIDLV